MNSNTKSIRVAIYVRVSTHYQVDKDSLPVQKDELSAYARYVLNAHSFEIFEDAGYSAKNTDRPEYQHMLSRVRAGEFTHILVWKLDRISRNLLDFAAMYEELKRLGVVFVSKNEQFDTSSAMGEAMLKIILVFAELERKMTAERVSAVMLSRASKGLWNGGRVPYGYRYDKASHQFSIIGSEAANILKMYDLYEKEHSLLKVAKTINTIGLRPRSGKEWSPATISLVIKNPFLTGAYRYNYFDMSKRGSRQDIKPKEEWVVVKDHHPAIIEEPRWKKICKDLQQNSRNGNASGKTYARKNTHVFSGLLICGECGAIMSANSSSHTLKNGYRPSNYACQSHRKGKGCTNKYVTDITVGNFVLNYIANLIKAKESFGRSTSIETLQKKLLRGETFKNVAYIGEQGLRDTYNLYKANIKGVPYTPAHRTTDKSENEIAILNAEQKRLERALGRLQSLYLYSENEMSKKEYLLQKAALEESLEKTSARIKELQGNSNPDSILSNEELFSLASQFVLNQKLLSKRTVDYSKLIMEIDPLLVKDFIRTVSTNFCIKNGKIVYITFKNGIKHEFFYID